MTICFVAQAVNLIMQLYILNRTGTDNQTGTGKHRAPIMMVQTSFLIVAICGKFGCEENGMFHPDSYIMNLGSMYSELTYGTKIV